MNRKPNIRHANIQDLDAIVDIYNQAIRSKTATGDMYEFTQEERVNWFNKFDRTDFPIYVVEINGIVIGYATLSPYRPGRKAMRKIAEISFYINYANHKMGIGSLLIQYVILEAINIGKETLLAILLDINQPSIRQLKKFNFEEWGHLPNVIDLNGSTCGHLIYGLKLKPNKI